VAALLLTGCAGPSGPVGAPPMNTEKPIGANEQLPGTLPPSTEQPVPTATTAALTSLTQPFTCPEQTAAPLDGGELRTALRQAKPGDVIYLEPNIYPGRFKITAKGTAERPIYLCGPTDAVLDGRAQNKGYVLHLDGAVHWRLSGFTVRNGLKGIMVDGGRHNVLQNLQVEETGDEAVHLRKESTDNVVQGLRIRKTGKVHPKFGEGLYVGTAQSNWCGISACGPDRSDRNQLLSNKMTLITAEAIDVKEGTSKGVISGNIFDGHGMTGADSWVDVKGNDWRIRENRGTFSPKDGFQTHVILPGWGDKNEFRGNTADLDGGSGVGFYLHKLLKNRVTCDNTVSGAKGGLSNLGCRG
jgi:hypothetical protein